VLHRKVLLRPLLGGAPQLRAGPIRIVARQIDDIRKESSEAGCREQVSTLVRLLQELRQAFRQLPEPSQEHESTEREDVRQIELSGDSRALLAKDVLAALRQLPADIPTAFEVRRNSGVEIGHSPRVGLLTRSARAMARSTSSPVRLRAGQPPVAV
jgi:hypothetical protein